MKFSIKDFSSKCNQIRMQLKISLMEIFIFCAVELLTLSEIQKHIQENQGILIIKGMLT